MKDEAPDPTAVPHTDGTIEGNATPDYNDILDWLEIEGEVENEMAGEFLTDAWLMKYGDGEMHDMQMAMGYLALVVQEYSDQTEDQEEVNEIRNELVEECWALANELERVSREE